MGVKNDIDAFVLPKLEEKGLKPNPRPKGQIYCVGATLRPSPGIPPTPEGRAGLLSEQIPDAFEEGGCDRLIALDPSTESEAVGGMVGLAAAMRDARFQASDERASRISGVTAITLIHRSTAIKRRPFMKKQIAGDELSPKRAQRHFSPPGCNRPSPTGENARQ